MSKSNNFNLNQILEGMKNDEYTERELNELPVNGKGLPCFNWSLGVWSWDDDTEQAIIGDGTDDLEIVGYDWFE